MANPFSEERRQRLQDDAKELLENFGKEYLKCFGLALFQKIKEEVEGDSDDPRKLKYRPWDEVERPELFSGFCYMKGGYGPGDFSKWKKVFIAETQDYKIHVYGSDKDYEKGKKPKRVISPCGYHLERDVAWFYRWELKDIASNLGLSDAELEGMTSFSPYSWSLVHPWRTNYIFQLHKGKDPACPCLGGSAVEPEGAGSEHAEDREKYVEAFDRCVNKCTVRNTEEVNGRAFDMTCDKLRGKIQRLSWWQDNGTEGEMLTDALMMQCMVPMRDDMMNDLKGPVGIRLAAWYKTRMVVYTTLEKLVSPAWGQVQGAAKKIQEKIEPTLRSGLGPVFEAKNNAKEKVREKVVNKLGDALANGVTPYLEPIFKAFDEPMTKGFECGREIFEKEVKIGALPADYKEMCHQLDDIPRTSDITHGVRTASWDLVAPLRLLKKMSDEVFSGLEIYEIRAQAEECMLSTLDATMFTLEDRIKENGKDDAENFKAQILQEYDHDVIIARATFVKEVTRAILITNFMRLIAPITEPVIETLNNVIPEQMQEFLNVEGLIDEVVNLFVGEPIDKMVDAAYPPP